MARQRHKLRHVYAKAFEKTIRTAEWCRRDGSRLMQILDMGALFFSPRGAVASTTVELGTTTDIILGLQVYGKRKQDHSAFSVETHAAVPRTKGLSASARLLSSTKYDTIPQPRPTIGFMESVGCAFRACAPPRLFTTYRLVFCAAGTRRLWSAGR